MTLNRSCIASLILLACLGIIHTSTNSLFSEEFTPAEKRLGIAMAMYTLESVKLLESTSHRMKSASGPGAKVTQKMLRSKMDNFEKDPLQIPRITVWRLAVGDIGYLHGGSMSKEDREKAGTSSGLFAAEFPHNLFKISQVIDDNNMIIVRDEKGSVPRVDGTAEKAMEVRLWVTGVSTSNLSDDAWIRLDEIYEVIGNKQYTTVLGGSKTILVVSPYEIQDISDVKRKAEENKKINLSSEVAKSSQPSRTYTARTWTSGTFTTVAKFRSMAGKQITLENADGKTIKIELDKLSAEDQEYIDGLKD